MDGSNHPKGSRSLRTLDLVPNLGEMIKPAELIDIRGSGNLTLAARRLYNLLISNAFGPDMARDDSVFEIGTTELRGTHCGTERLEDLIEALMKTIVVARLPDGTTTRVQLLGGNNLGAPDRQRGRLRYAFPPQLIPLLRESSIFGILELRVMAAFSTKYALGLYEAVSRRVRMDKIGEEVDVDAMREMLGVPRGKLDRINNFRAKAIVPAVQEINALAPFSVRIDDIKRGKAVVGFRLWWWRKSAEDYRAAMAELEQPRLGRAARIRGRDEQPAHEALIEQG